MKVACDKCHGTGEVEIEETRCVAEIVIGSETIGCFGEDRHPGEPHMAILGTPCYACGQYDEHDATCGVYDMAWSHGEDWASRWYAWRDGDLAIRRVASEVGQTWREHHQPTSPHARPIEAAA